MNFKDAVKTCLRKYVTFEGRAARSEYWWFYLFFILVIIVAMIVDNVLGTTFRFGGANLGYGYVYVLACLALFLPNLAVGVRRLHDKNKSGWWYLIGLIPLAGIVLLVWFVTKGTTGSNRFGPDPLQPGTEVFN